MCRSANAGSKDRSRQAAACRCRRRTVAAIVERAPNDPGAPRQRFGRCRRAALRELRFRWHMDKRAGGRSRCTARAASRLRGLLAGRDECLQIAQAVAHGARADFQVYRPASGDAPISQSWQRKFKQTGCFGFVQKCIVCVHAHYSVDPRAIGVPFKLCGLRGTAGQLFFRADVAQPDTRGSRARA